MATPPKKEKKTTAGNFSEERVMRTYTFRDILPLINDAPLENALMGQNWPGTLQLNSERRQEQGATNCRLLNIQTVPQAAEYPSQDDKRKQLAARQPKECQTNGRYLTQSAAIQGQSVRQLDESLPCEAASTTRLPGGLLNNVLRTINTYFLHVSSTEHTLTRHLSLVIPL